MQKHPTVILVGETGSGKTTQIPQFLHESRLDSEGAVAITQPRRMAAVSIATRVALEMGVTLGQMVGYKVRWVRLRERGADHKSLTKSSFSARFDNVTDERTKLVYLTDGMLLREAMLGKGLQLDLVGREFTPWLHSLFAPLFPYHFFHSSLAALSCVTDQSLSRYSWIILDEAHERTVNTDILFGVVKSAQAARISDGKKKPLRIIIMSATLDTEKFSRYFRNAPVLFVRGRQFAVNVHHASNSHDDWLGATLSTVFQIHKEAPERWARR